MNQEQADVLARFSQLPAVDPREMIGLWRGRGIPTSHPLDGVLENLDWFGKRFRADMRADALLFTAGERRLVPLNPAYVPLRLALRLSGFGRSRAARNLFSHLKLRFRAEDTVASLKTLSFQGALSAAMVYDKQPIVDHFRKIDADHLMGVMTVEEDDRLYFFELSKLDEAPPPAPAAAP
jgi:hypothetical protein